MVTLKMATKKIPESPTIFRVLHSRYEQFRLKLETTKDVFSEIDQTALITQ